MPGLHAEHALEDVVDEKVPLSHGAHVFVAVSRPLPGGHVVATKVGDGVVLAIVEGVAVGESVFVAEVVNTANVLETDCVCMLVGEKVGV